MNDLWFHSRLNTLESYVRAFDAALKLFNFSANRLGEILAQPDPAAFSSERSVLWEWSLIACRDGAMSIYHYRFGFQGIYEALNTSARVRADEKCMADGSRVFHEAFPEIVKLRHKIAHAAETTTPKNFAKNASREGFEGRTMAGGSPGETPGQQVMLGSFLEGRRFTTTLEGRHLSYEICDETLETLRESLAHFRAAFASIL